MKELEKMFTKFIQSKNYDYPFSHRYKEYQRVLIENKEVYDIIEKRINQRVIEELENICNDEETDYIIHRINELKEELKQNG